MELIKLPPKYYQWQILRLELLAKFVKYGFVACGSAASDWVVFSLLVLFFGLEPIFGQMIARLAGGFFSFCANKYWSFKANKGERIGREGRRFLLLYFFSYVLSISLFWLATFFDLSPFLAKLSTDGMILIFNFIVMNYYVFNERKGLISFLFSLPKNKKF